MFMSFQYFFCQANGSVGVMSERAIDDFNVEHNFLMSLRGGLLLFPTKQSQHN
jgi:hypothetical protein